MVGRIPGHIVHHLYMKFVQPVVRTASPISLMSRLQTAHWFYVDHVQSALLGGPQVKPSLTFTAFLHHFVRLLHWKPHEVRTRLKAFWKFNATVPRAGGLLLNAAQTKLVLVRAPGAKRWSFPVGKVHEDEHTEPEPEHLCAVREVFEETGFLGQLTAETRSFTYHKRRALHRLFVFENVPEDYAFSPLSAQEIAEVRWIPFADLTQYLSRSLCTALVAFLGVYVYPVAQTGGGGDDTVTAVATTDHTSTEETESPVSACSTAPLSSALSLLSLVAPAPCATSSVPL